MNVGRTAYYVCAVCIPYMRNAIIHPPLDVPPSPSIAVPVLYMMRIRMYQSLGPTSNNCTLDRAICVFTLAPRNLPRSSFHFCLYSWSLQTYTVYLHSTLHLLLIPFINRLLDFLSGEEVESFLFRETSSKASYRPGICQVNQTSCETALRKNQGPFLISR